jgi:hypothetical protein
MVEKERITKLQAGQRQLVVATKLYFRGSDAVAIARCPGPDYERCLFNYYPTIKADTIKAEASRKVAQKCPGYFSSTHSRTRVRAAVALGSNLDLWLYTSGYQSETAASSSPVEF